MKILNQVDLSNWKHQCICKECDTELEIEANDIRFERYNGDQRDPGYDLYYVECPVCQDTVNIDENKFPKALKIVIQKKYKIR